MDCDGLLDQNSPEKTFPERDPSRLEHRHPSGTKFNYFEIYKPVFLPFHHGFSERFYTASFLVQYLNTCKVLFYSYFSL